MVRNSDSILSATGSQLEDAEQDRGGEHDWIYSSQDPSGCCMRNRLQEQQQLQGSPVLRLLRLSLAVGQVRNVGGKN